MAHYRRKRGASFSNISFSRSAAKVPPSLDANISPDVVLLLQYYGSLDQLKNQCRDAGRLSSSPGNYEPARLSLRMRSSRSASYPTISVSI
jgi:hypothetical protein